MAGSPSFPFYPRDYRGDPNVRRASFAARGVYMEILCLAHECEPRGSLATNGKPWTDGQIANAVGGDPRQVTAALTELIDLFVLSRDEETGLVFSRRMRRDTERYLKAREDGQKGGNPVVRGRRVNPTLNPTPNRRVNGSEDENPEDPQPPSSFFVLPLRSSPSGVNPPDGGVPDFDDEPFVEDPPAPPVAAPSAPPAKKATRVRPATPANLDEVKAYWAEADLAGRPEAFFDYHTSKGWLVGKTPMRDWRAAARTWSHNERSRYPSRPSGPPPSAAPRRMPEPTPPRGSGPVPHVTYDDSIPEDLI